MNPFMSNCCISTPVNVRYEPYRDMLSAIKCWNSEV